MCPEAPVNFKIKNNRGASIKVIAATVVTRILFYGPRGLKPSRPLSRLIHTMVWGLPIL